jgi:DNA repair exonuclease SbcCD ATPase subunit
MKRFVILCCIACLLPIATAQAQTLEEQLRAQLRDARSQLQDLQGSQAQWQAQKAALEQERDQARKVLEAAQAESRKPQGPSARDVAALATERTAREHAEAENKRLQAIVADDEAKAREQAGRSTGAATELSAAQAQVERCTAKNQQLYAVASEILDAYSHIGVGTVLASREPFAASARVKLENAAQAYGDRLYEQRYDPRATVTEKPAKPGKP